MDRLQITNTFDEEEANGPINPFNDHQSGGNADPFKSPEKVKAFEYSSDDESDKEEMRNLRGRTGSICDMNRKHLLS